MRHVLLGLGVALVFAAGGLGASRARPVVVQRIDDGDTLVLTDGRKVRLLQIDAPELESRECYGAAAYHDLLALVPTGSRVTLEADPRLDQVDRYGRILRYVRRNGVNVNLELVRRGDATPYFYRGDRGRYAALLLRAARSAKAARLGLWGACPGTRLDPDRAANTGRATGSTRPSPLVGNCAPSYPTVCIPPPPPDLDCKDIRYRSFTVRWDVPDPDPHHFDGNHDGVGCELPSP